MNRGKLAFRNATGYVAHGTGVRGSAFRGLAAFDQHDFDELRTRDLTNNTEIDGIVMVLENPTPDDIPLLLCADALLAAKGGSTSHATVAINGISDRDYHAVVGASALRVNAIEHRAVVLASDGSELAAIGVGDMVSIDGATGAVYVGSREVERL